MRLLAILKPILGRMPSYISLMYMILSDPAVKKRHKVHLGGGLLYALSPIDLIPGLIPFVGQLDDVIVALSALLRVLRQMPPDTRDSLLSRAGIGIETVESDLKKAKLLALYLAVIPVTRIGEGAKWIGNKAGGLVAGARARLRARTRRP